MPELIFYRQKRYDGGIRTGIDLDNETIAERYEDGADERDPALLWYIDLRCEGPGVPDQPDAAERWLLDQSTVIRDGFARFAERVRSGADPDIFPLTWSEFNHVPEGVTMTIACSAIRRVVAREVASHLIEVGDHWVDIVRSFEAPQEVEDLR